MRAHPLVIPAALILFGAVLFFLSPATGQAADPNEDCFMCHADDEMEGERDGQWVSMAVHEDALQGSVHEGLDCVDCHSAIDPDDLPHDEELPSVYCGDCHDDVQLDFDISIHGQALIREAPYAPACKDCHGTHQILSPQNPEAMAFKMNVPVMCGGCHREGAPVADTYEIAAHNIIENYSQSIHGEGLFQKGLTVTATCTDCHGSHTVLPHTNPQSSIAPRNISKTCMKCHSKIEEVHVKVIRGELWETEPGAIPSCTDCHLPHKVRKEILSATLDDRDCLKCHGEPDVFKVADGDTVSMTVDHYKLQASVHDNIPCVKCHTDVDPTAHGRPCVTAGQAQCSNCHAKMWEEYSDSGHGQAHARGEENAPYCTTCHGVHGVKSHSDEDSPTYRASVPELCGDCHREGGAAPASAELTQVDALTDYSFSVHGRGLTEKGLLPSAVCIDCHGSHLVLHGTDERASIHPDNIPATCGSCHRGIYKDFIKSIHYDAEGRSDKELPSCIHCHSAHTISETGQDQFMTEVTHQCGSCHEELAETYLETMHGKAYQLGYLRAAKCSDCHGDHLILGHNDPQSSVGFANIVETCQKCHEDANARFTGYLTHATHHDPDRYPWLYWTYRTMTGLLLGVFGFFGVHTLLWLPRSFASWRERRRHHKTNGPDYFIRRFTRTQRFKHLLVILSFLSLALTGMMLKFSGMAWAATLADLLGGVRVAGVIHRVAAVVTLGYFVIHLVWLARHKHKRNLTLKQLVLGPDSMMFNKKDIKDFWMSVKWFVGLGTKPAYGRFTYWEKFDYLAVFWGVAVIGLSGLMLWFPEFFTRFVPGWGINIATIIHSDEALLAVGFIFTIHFFNTHLRPEAFPMDTVVFTGIARVEEYKKDRPHEYAQLRKSGELAKRVVRQNVSPTKELLVRIAGYTFLAVGLVLIGLIIYSVLFGYQI